jgi:hypothetical protein
MNNLQKFSVNPKYTIEQLDTEILLYAVSSTQGIYLNETAYLIWQMCTVEQSVEQMIAKLEQAYPQQSAAVRWDVLTAVQSLVDNGALILCNE